MRRKVQNFFECVKQFGKFNSDICPFLEAILSPSYAPCSYQKFIKSIWYQIIFCFVFLKTIKRKLKGIKVISWAKAKIMDDVTPNQPVSALKMQAIIVRNGKVENKNSGIPCIF